MTSWSRRALSALVVLALSAAATHARADGTDAARCYDAHEAGQLLRKNGEWRRARARFAVCANATCPALVARDCVAWTAELEQRLPSVLFAVVDEDGKDVPHGRIDVDGVALESEARAVDLDPGEHRVRVAFAGEADLVERFVVREGERGRRIALVRASPRTTVRAPVPLASIVLGGTAAVALGSFGVFAALGKSRENELADTCANRCSDEDVAGVRRNYILADVSLGVAVVTTGMALAIWLTRPAVTTPARRTALLEF